MAAMDTRPKCQNQGCGMRFDVSTNSDTACQYHPGPAIFHDAKKGWQCCDRHVIEFDQFLAIEGCTRGPHREAPRVDKEALAAKQAEANKLRPKCYVHFEGEPSFTWPCYLDSYETIGALKTDFVTEYNRAQQAPPARLPLDEVGLWSAQRKLLHDALLVAHCIAKNDDVYCEALPQRPAAQVAASAPPSAPVQDAASPASAASDAVLDPDQERRCLNVSCGASYRERDNSDSACRHHLSLPYFHDGSQGYACCKRVMSFDEFELIQPCQIGRHCDVPHAARPASAVTRTAQAGPSWEQDAESITIILPLAGVSRTNVDVEIEDGTALTITVTRRGEKDYMHVVDPLKAAVRQSSSVTTTPSDVRVKLTKRKTGMWPTLS